MNNFIVYNASAGSGKTTILSIEYIILTLQNPDKYKKILAVTFTNKAAAEMKERIISYLKSLASWELENNKPLLQNLDYIKQRTSLEEEQIKKHAEKTLQNILHSYSDFAVKTIDSFIHRIVRTFAYDLQLPIDFDIETDSDKLLSQAIDILISKAGIENDLTDALVEFTEEKTNDNKSWHIENDLFEFSKILLDEEGQINTAKLQDLTIKDFEKIKLNIQKFFAYFDKYLSDKAIPIIQKANELNLSAQAFAGGKNGIMKYFEYIKNKRYDKLEPSNTVKKYMDEEKWHSGKANAEEKNKIDSIKASIKRAYNEILIFANENKSKYYVLELVYKKLYPLAVLNETDKILNEIKSQNNLMHISDFNKKVSQIVLSEPIPFIYERVGEKFDHFFIDEFQDTSVMQWQNMLPLIDNSLASNNYNMLVGDGKQAIYRWRNGNVEQFINLPNIDGQTENQIIAERAATLHRNFQKIELNANYRSKKEIVEFNNEFFNHVANILPDKFKSIYDGLSQTPKKGEGGTISIEFLEKDTNESYLQQTFEKIELLIRKLNKQYQLQDIGILCRSNRQANAIAEYLLPKGLDVVSSESLLLCNSEKVNFIVTLLQIITNPKDTTAIVAAINFLAKDINGDKLHAYAQRMLKELQNVSYIKILTSLQNLQAEEVQEISSSLHFLPIYDLCEELVRIFKLATDNDPFIAFFLEIIWEFSNKHTSGLNSFINWWDENKHKQFITVPQGLEAVNIMTIHKAKGLQFPVVIYPFADERLKTTKTNLWLDSNYQELGNVQNPIVNSNSSLQKTEYANTYNDEQERSLLDLINILYVSLTRPEEQLYIFCEMPGDKESKSVPYYFKNYLEAKDLWSADQKEYTLGNFKIKNAVSKDNVTPTKKTFKELISTSWKEKIKISRSAETVWNLDSNKNNTQWGNIVHSILAMVKTQEDIEPSINKALNKGWINKEQKEEISSKLKSLIQSILVKKFFSEENTIITEKEILTSEGKVYRPDRIVLSAEETSIIDYKTGKEENKYKKQIAQYTDLLIDMGYKNVKSYLLYIEKEKLVEC